MLFLNSWRVSSHIVRYDTNPPAIQKQQWHIREAQIEPSLFECEYDELLEHRRKLSNKVIFPQSGLLYSLVIFENDELFRVTDLVT
jgi:hypothetical protein